MDGVPASLGLKTSQSLENIETQPIPEKKETFGRKMSLKLISKVLKQKKEKATTIIQPDDDRYMTL